MGGFLCCETVTITMTESIEPDLPHRDWTAHFRFEKMFWRQWINAGDIYNIFGFITGIISYYFITIVF
jgi:hypothetical protein